MLHHMLPADNNRFGEISLLVLIMKVVTADMQKLMIDQSTGDKSGRMYDDVIFNLFYD